MLSLVSPPVGPSMLRPSDLGRSVPSLTKQSLTWLGRETIFAGDVFSRVLATVLVLRGINWMIRQWWGSEEIWNQGDALLKNFQTTKPTTAEPEPDASDRPRFLFENEGLRFYSHSEVFNGQYFACPIRLAEDCVRCTHFIRRPDGRPDCAAVAKVKLTLARNERFMNASVYDIADAMRAEFGKTGTYN